MTKETAAEPIPDNHAIAAVKEAQRNLIGALHELAPIPKHEPEMALMGCVDARVRTADLGIPDGKALIERNIAALIPAKSDGKDSLATEAFLEFDIVVMGHTDCGGVKGCLCGTCGFDAKGEPYEMNAVERYLEPLHPARDKVRAEYKTIEEQQAALERATVCQSYENLMTYPVVQKAVASGQLKLHGWLIHTDSLYLDEMQPDKTFKPLVEMRYANKVLERRQAEASAVNTVS